MLSQTNISWTQNRKIQQNLRNLRHLLSSASVKSWVKFSVLPRSVTHGICIYASLFSLKKALFKNHSFLGVDWLNESIQPGHSASIAHKGYQRLWDEFSWHFPPFFVWHVLTQATANLGWVPCIFKPQFRIESVCFRKGFQEILGRGTFQTLPLLVFWPRERERERQQMFTILFLLHFGYPTGTASFWETSNVENEKALRVWGECFSRQQQKVGIWWSPKVTKVLRGSPTFKDTKSYHTMPEWQKIRYHSEECYLMPLI